MLMKLKFVLKGCIELLQCALGTLVQAIKSEDGFCLPIMALLSSSCVTLGKSLNLSVPVFPLVKLED